MKYLAFFLLFFSVCFAGELDLPILPPDDPRRELYEKREEAEIPKKPEVEIPPDEPPPPIFFGEIIPETESIVYVLDFSNSMMIVHRRIDYRTTVNRWQTVQMEAARSISALAESFEFDVVIFGTNGGCGVTQWQQNLVKATQSNKEAAIAWIMSFEDVAYYGGATPTAPAVIVAIALEPATIILLTDGQPSVCGISPRSGQPPWITHRKRIAAENKEPIPIQVFGIGLPDEKALEFCVGVAGDSTGTFYEIKKG